MLGTIDIVLITKNAVDFLLALDLHREPTARDSCSSNVPNGHAGARNLGEADGSRETLVTLGVIVLEADLKLDGLEEVSLLGLQGVLQEFFDVGTHSGWRGRLGQLTCSVRR
jgi:hypothetical protein